MNQRAPGAPVAVSEGQIAAAQPFPPGAARTVGYDAQKGPGLEAANIRAMQASDSLTAGLAAHYALVAPLLEATLGPIPVVSASFPSGLGAPAQWHTKALPLVPHVFEWCVTTLHAVEFHSWTPRPDRPDRLAYARILLESVGVPNETRLREAAGQTRAALNAVNLDAIAVLDGAGGIALMLPFDDAPAYDEVRAWLHQFANQLAAQHGDLVTTEPNTRGGNLVHIHVNHNAVRAWSALPYSARGLPNLPVSLPIAWSELDAIDDGSVTIATLPARVAAHGDVLAAQRARIGTQSFGSLQRHAVTLAIASRGHVIQAAMRVLADGTTRSAEQIFEEAVTRGLLPNTYNKKYVYTALIEYIARANGNGRKTYIVQDAQRSFRINEPPDDWPDLAPPAPLQPDAQAQALCDRLTATSTGTDPAAFEVAVCDAFAHLGFAATHVGGFKAPDGYADALLGPLGYRVMIECKTGKGDVTQPDAFEAAKYRDAFHAQYCTLVGPAFPDQVELTQELHIHGVCAWTADDLKTALLCDANAYELRPCFEPGYAADALTDLLWNRNHGQSKRIRVIAELICQTGRVLQTTAAREGTPADAPLLTVDTAMALVDQALAVQGSSQACTRDDVCLAFDYLTSPVIARAIWTGTGATSIAVTSDRVAGCRPGSP